MTDMTTFVTFYLSYQYKGKYVNNFYKRKAMFNKYDLFFILYKLVLIIVKQFLFYFMEFF